MFSRPYGDKGGVTSNITYWSERVSLEIVRQIRSMNILIRFSVGRLPNSEV